MLFTQKFSKKVLFPRYNFKLDFKHEIKDFIVILCRVYLLKSLYIHLNKLFCKFFLYKNFSKFFSETNKIWDFFKKSVIYSKKF